MKASRLKNIVIVILLLVNLFLLFPLIYRHMQERSAYERSVSELTELFESNHITVSPSVLPQQFPAAVPELIRDTDQEKAFATALLGPLFQRDVGGGILRYYNENGVCLVRSNGAVDAQIYQIDGDPEQLCAAICSSFGYEIVRSDMHDRVGSIVLVRMIGGARICNATLTFTFRDEGSASVAGSLLTAYSEKERTDGMDAVSALVRFLDYRNSPGATFVCTAITGLESGYLLQSTTTEPLRLVPVWRVHTDVSNYYVNCLNGDVTRE